jgi:site-specific DNA-methyltransferase (adenine-specific)
MNEPLPINQVLEGDCLEILADFPAGSVDLVFADPPYNLQLSQELYRPNMTRVEGVDEAWDQFDGFEAYDAFSQRWLAACRRVLKPNGSMWVIGTYHNIFRLGRIMQDLGFWFLNDVIWVKTNPMPNFRGVRFTNAHETLIWAARDKDARYTFNYHAMKRLNDDLQMRSDWVLSICSGAERIKMDGSRAHPTQKPEALLYRVLLATTNPGDVVLDPFFGTGTTGAVAKRLHRSWIGIEQDQDYAAIARARIDSIRPEPFDEATFDVRDRRRKLKRIPFARLLEMNLIRPGQVLCFQKDRNRTAKVKPDGQLRLGGFEGSIHQAGRHLRDGSPCNGWEHWYFETADGGLRPIDDLRQEARRLLAERGEV